MSFICVFFPLPIIGFIFVNLFKKKLEELLTLISLSSN
jgi:hypothetical protein